MLEVVFSFVWANDRTFPYDFLTETIFNTLYCLTWLDTGFCRSDLLSTCKARSTQRRRRRSLLHLPQHPATEIFQGGMGGVYPEIDQESSCRVHSNPRVCPVGRWQCSSSASRERGRQLLRGRDHRELQLLGRNWGRSRWSSRSDQAVGLACWLN